MKKLLFLKGCLLLIFAMLTLTSVSYAADEVIYNNQNGVSTTDKEIDLEGWGYEITDTCFYEADVKFGGEGAGVTLVNADGTKCGTSIRAVDRDGTLTLAADGGTGSYFIYYIPVDTEAWYHIKLIGSYGVENALVDMTVDTYDNNMNITDTKNYYVILMNEMYASSGNAPEHIRAEANTELKNIAVTHLVPDEIVINAPSSKVQRGTSIELTVKAYRNGSELNCALTPEYTISGTDKVSIENGRVTVSEDAELGTKFSVEANCNGIKTETVFEVISDAAVEIGAAYVDDNEITAVDVLKNFYVSGECAVVVNIYRDGMLADSFIKPFNVSAIEAGAEVQIPVGYKYEENMSDCETEISVWCVGEGEKPNLHGKAAIRELFEECGGYVAWNADFRSITAAVGGSVYAMQADNNKIYIDGEALELKDAVYIENDKSYVVFD